MAFAMLTTPCSSPADRHRQLGVLIGTSAGQTENQLVVGLTNRLLLRRGRTCPTVEAGRLQTIAHRLQEAIGVLEHLLLGLALKPRCELRVEVLLRTDA